MQYISAVSVIPTRDTFTQSFQEALDQCEAQAIDASHYPGQTGRVKLRLLSHSVTPHPVTFRPTLTTIWRLKIIKDGN